MNIRKKLIQPSILLPMLSVGILCGFTVLLSGHSQPAQQSNQSKSIAKIFKLKPSKKQKTSHVISAQTLLSPSPSQTSTLPVIHKSGTLTANETWIAGNVYVIDNTLLVPSGITLTITSGTIVKFANSSQSIRVATGAIVDAQGDASNPIIFTSYYDDSVGGDSDSSTSTIPARGDYDTVFFDGGGDITINSAISRYGNSTIRADYIECSHSGTLTINDSELDSPVIPGFCTNTLSMQRNVINSSVGQAIYTQGLADASSIILSGPNQNIFTGNPIVTLISSYIPYGSVWNVSPSSGAVPDFSNVTVNGTLNIEAGSVAYISHGGINVNGQMSVGHGVILKVDNPSQSILVGSGGGLNLNGTATSPVVITSYHDDSFGGDSDANGPSVGNVADYNIAIKADYGSSINVAGTNIYFAARAFELSGQATLTNVTVNRAYLGFEVTVGHATMENVSINHVQVGMHISAAEVVFRGSFMDVSYKAIQACNWISTNCSVDASYTDWGGANGPSGLVCGKAMTLPWKYGVSVQNGENVFVPNCDDSLSPDQVLNVSISRFQQAANNKWIDCSNGFQDACDARDRAFACLSSSVNLASSTIPFPVPQIAPDGTGIQTFGDAVKDYGTSYLREQAVESVAGSTFATIINPVVSAFQSLSDAYNSCAP